MKFIHVVVMSIAHIRMASMVTLACPVSPSAMAAACLTSGLQSSQLRTTSLKHKSCKMYNQELIGSSKFTLICYRKAESSPSPATFVLQKYIHFVELIFANMVMIAVSSMQSLTPKKKFADKFSPMGMSGKIGKNFLLAKTSSYTVSQQPMMSIHVHVM